MVGREFDDQLTVQAFASVDHGKERYYHGIRGVFIAELEQLLVGADRKVRRDQRDEEDIGHIEDILRDQRHTRRAVQKNDVVIVANLAQQFLEAACRAVVIVQLEVEVAVGIIGRNQIEIVEIRAADGFREIFFLFDQRRGATTDARFDAKVEARGALGIEVPEQAAQTAAGGEIGQVDRRRGFADAALEIISGDNFHEPAWPKSPLKCRALSRSAKRRRVLPSTV